MTTYQAQIPLGGLPVHLVLVGNRDDGKVVFVRVAPYNGDILDMPNDLEGVAAMFGPEGFYLAEVIYRGGNGEYFEYNTVYDYKNIPLMLRWLQQQELQQPE